MNEEDWNTAEDSSQEGNKKKKRRNGNGNTDDEDDYDNQNENTLDNENTFYNDGLTDEKNKSKFNFSGLSFKDYVRSIQEELNDELKILVNLFI